jgi:hypothetical protein
LLAVSQGALKNSKAREVDNTPLVLIPGTFYTSPGCGVGKRGVDLTKCYQVLKQSGHNQSWSFLFGNCMQLLRAIVLCMVYGSTNQQVQELHPYAFGTMQQGEYVQDQRHGRGTYKYANGYATYEGDYNNGVKHGAMKTGKRFLIM